MPSAASRNERFFDCGLFLRKEQILAVGDLHLGIESRLKTASFPLHQKERVFSKLDFLVSELKPKKIVLCGDLVEGFSFSLRQKKLLSELFSALSSSCEVIAVKGNHDISLRGPEFNFLEVFEFSDYCFAHGDSLVETKCSTIVLGHEHPSVIVSDGLRSEKFKCFLSGESSWKRTIFLPSFSPIFSGADVLSEWGKSPFAKSISNFSIFVCSEKEDAKFFGRVRDLKN